MEVRLASGDASLIFTAPQRIAIFAQLHLEQERLVVCRLQSRLLPSRASSEFANTIPGLRRKQDRRTSLPGNVPYATEKVKGPQWRGGRE